MDVAPKYFLTSSGLAAHVNIFEPVSKNNKRTGSDCKFPTLGLVDTTIEFGSDIHRCIGANYRGDVNAIISSIIEKMFYTRL